MPEHLRKWFQPLRASRKTCQRYLRWLNSKKRLDECGVECRNFSCAGKLHELRTAANAIKHGTGPAGDELAKLRPDLFGGSAEVAPVPDFIYTPLAGEDLYVSERDLSEWCDAAIAFWEKLSAILDDHQRRQSVG